jgi:hypothetical protein
LILAYSGVPWFMARSVAERFRGDGLERDWRALLSYRTASTSAVAFAESVTSSPL